MSKWNVRELGAIVEFLSGYAWKAAGFSDCDSGIPIIRIQNVDSVRQSDFVYWLDKYDDRFLINEGDILLTLSGSFRAEVWQGPTALLNQRIVKITPKEGTDRNWLLYALRNTLSAIEAMGRHALVNNVALSDLRKMKLICPPLEEQKRIAAILDQADALRRLRQRSINRLNSLGQAIFYEMFGNPVSNPKNLPLEELACLIKVGSGDGLTSEQQTGGVYPVYGGNGINGWHSEYNVEADTIVIGRVGVYCGSIHTTYCRSWVTDNALIVKPLKEINLTYLADALSLSNLNQYAGRSSQPLISGQRIYPVKILMPDIEAQQEYSKKILIAKKLGKTFDSHSFLIDSLFQSLQHRAFNGELSGSADEALQSLREVVV